MSTPNRTGLAGFWAAVSAAAVPGVAPSASVAAPSVFTNVRRSVGMPSICYSFPSIAGGTWTG